MLLPFLVSSSSALSYKKDFTDFDLVSARQERGRSIISSVIDGVDAASQLIPLVEGAVAPAAQTPVSCVIDQSMKSLNPLTRLDPLELSRAN